MIAKVEHKEDSFIKMYGFKLIASVVIIVVTTATQMILARSLGTTDYGYYNYNINIFTTFITLIYAGTSDAFYSKISKRREEKELTQFYLYYNLLIFLILNIIVFVMSMTGFSKYIWQNQKTINLLLALYFTFLTYLINIFTSLSDAYALTRYTELGKVVQKVLVFILICIAYYFTRLNLSVFYVFQIITFILIIGFFIVLFKRTNIITIKKIKFIDLFKKYKAEFYEFCKPMFFMLLLNSVLIMAENWFVVHYSSISEQAYYGVANQINSVLSYIFTPLILLLVRQFAIAISSDKSSLGEMYVKYSNSICVIIAFFACYIIVSADWISCLFGGNKYLPAVPAIILMMIYTIGQTMGQINGSLFIASERTKEYSYIAFIGIGVSIILDYLLLVPNFIIAKPLGAVGLTLKMWLSQFIVCNLLTYLNCKYLKINFRRLFSIQFVSPVIFLLCGYGVRYGITLLVNLKILANNDIVLFLLAGFIYVMIVLLIVTKTPKLLGLDTNYAELLFYKIKSRLNTKEC